MNIILCRGLDPGCPVPVVLSQLSCPSCPVLDVWSQLSCQCSPATVVPSRLPCFSWTVLAIRFWQSCPLSFLSCPYLLTVFSGCFVLFLLACPGFSVSAVLLQYFCYQLSYPCCPVLTAMAWPCGPPCIIHCPGFTILTVLSGCPARRFGPAVLSGLSY